MFQFITYCIDFSFSIFFLSIAFVRLQQFITRFLAGVFLVPLLVLVLLAWTIVGRLCSLGGRTIFLVLLVLAVIPLIADPDFFGQQGNYMYAFDASLIGEKKV